MRPRNKENSGRELPIWQLPPAWDLKMQKYRGNGKQRAASALSGDDLDPVSVGIGDEIDTHGGILKADTAHGRVLLMGKSKVINRESQMKLTLAKVIGLGTAGEAGQFKGEIALAVTKEDKMKAAVRGGFLADRLQAERFLIKGERAAKVKNIEIIVVKFKHGSIPFKVFFKGRREKSRGLQRNDARENGRVMTCEDGKAGGIKTLLPNPLERFALGDGIEAKAGQRERFP